MAQAVLTPVAYCVGCLVSTLSKRFRVHRLTSSEEGYEVVCFLANVGQEEDWDAVEKKARHIGAKKMIIEDLRREFVEELCFRAIQCNAMYECRYLLGMTSIDVENELTE